MNIDPRVFEQAVAVEKTYFVKTDRREDPKKINPFLYLKGHIPVLVSAPHGVRHIRKKAIKQSDIHTGSLAYLLHGITGCHTLAVTKLYGGDPNWDDPCIYKERVGEICREHKIKMVLDLHGAGSDHDFDVDLGTMHGRSLLGREQILPIVKTIFIEQGLKKVSVDYFPACPQKTVTFYASNILGIPALQIEINRKYRVPNQNGLAYRNVLEALAQVVNYLGA